MNASPSVLVTGLGAVSPVGATAEESWESILAGRSGVRLIEHFDTSNYAVKIAGDVTEPDPQQRLPRPDARRLESYAQLGIAAGLEALADAGIEEDALREGADCLAAERFAIVVGTGYGCTRTNAEAVRRLDSAGPDRLTPVPAVYGAQDIVAGYLSTRIGAQGEAFSLSTACASGTVAIGAGARLIAHGDADVVLVIGADGRVEDRDLAIVSASRALTTAWNDSPERASRPFDRARSGFVLSCGGAALVLESAAHARARGVHARATVLGYGARSDAHHPTAPHPAGRGAMGAMRAALRAAGLGAEDIGHVNAHGTGTRLNDEVEAAAISTVLSDRRTPVPVTSTKSLTGHMIGAAGTFEAVVTVRALETGLVPPTANCDDLEYELDVVRGEPRRVKTRVAMSNSFGFGGHNSCVILGAGDE